MDERNLSTRITVNPNVMLGKPTIRGLRITVEQLLKALAAGNYMLFSLRRSERRHVTHKRRINFCVQLGCHTSTSLASKVASFLPLEIGPYREQKAGSFLSSKSR